MLNIYIMPEINLKLTDERETPMRLDKFLSDSTPYSRSGIKILTRKGLVSVNGQTATRADMHIAESDLLTVEGKAVSYRKYIYLMMNKPSGYLSATEDKRDPVVTDLLPDEYRHFEPFPVGRLDKDTEGLLLLSNDGQFAHSISSPGKNIYKRYFAVLDQPAEAGDIEAFKAGMDFKEFSARPALLEITPNPREVYIEIAEGKFHQVKRMCERVGKTVLHLRRVAIGGLPLDPGLPLGGVRELSAEEMAEIRN